MLGIQAGEDVLFKAGEDVQLRLRRKDGGIIRDVTSEESARMHQTTQNGESSSMMRHAMEIYMCVGAIFALRGSMVCVPACLPLHTPPPSNNNNNKDRHLTLAGLKSALAKASSCFWPALSGDPPSDSSVSSPSDQPSNAGARWERLRAAHSSASEWPPKGDRLVRMLPVNSTGTWQAQGGVAHDKECGVAWLVPLVVQQQQVWMPSPAAVTGKHDLCFPFSGELNGEAINPSPGFPGTHQTSLHTNTEGTHPYES